MEIVAVRHATTPYNEQHLINGMYDEPLSAAGMAQIPALIGSLEGYSLTVVYCSALLRARRTALPIAEHFGVPLVEDDRITEVDFGSFAGQSWDSTIPYFGVNSSGVLNTYTYDLRPFGGECADDTRNRVRSFVDDLRANPQALPLLVCHGGILRWLYHLYSDERRQHIANATVHHFTL
ncbi:MAG TPA: histidine phosphatase family protein [Candidatus Saccharimonadales bacterium]|nr:histidine phosphatase family protein [Candidatus Saccharimonadales bacterium]